MLTQAQIDALAWFHDFDFDGLAARSSDRAGAAFHRVLWSFILQQFDTIDWQGKRVLDVGAWDGYFSFEAEARGAASVLAVDDFSQNWGTPEAFRLAKGLKCSAVTLLPDVPVYELDRRVNGPFDIVLLLGVYYHLHAPYEAFARVRGVCHDDSLVLIEGDCFRNGKAAEAQVQLDNPYGPKFIPTTCLLRQMLHACYLRVERMAFLGDTPSEQRLRWVPPEQLLEMARHAAHAQEQPGGTPGETAGFRRWHGALRDRVLVFARPFCGENRYHLYKPPFGLERFDTRREWGN